MSPDSWDRSLGRERQEAGINQVVRNLQRKLLSGKRKLEPYHAHAVCPSTYIWSLLPILQELLGPHLNVQVLGWGWGYHLQPKDRSGLKKRERERNRKAVRLTQISPLSVNFHFRFCWYVLFSMNNLIISKNWGLKVWFHSILHMQYYWISVLTALSTFLWF